jgi:hypothetical protein
MVKREATGLMLAKLTVKLLCLENGDWNSFRRKKNFYNAILKNFKFAVTPYTATKFYFETIFFSWSVCLFVCLFVVFFLLLLIVVGFFFH